MKRILIPSLIFIHLLFAGSAHAATGHSLRVVPQKESVAVGETLVVNVYAVSPDQSINAVSGVLAYPAAFSLQSISKQGTVINFWTHDVQSNLGQIPFEGVIVSPGYQGQGGLLFSASFVAKTVGTATFKFNDGALLANDGLGTNILNTLGSATVRITEASSVPVSAPENGSRTASSKNPLAIALPVITDFSQSIETNGKAFFKGKGQPNAMTKITFADVAAKSLGERFIELLQTKKKKLDHVLVKNDEKGNFEYTSPDNLLAGTYNATPFLVDEATAAERPGLGVQLFVNDSRIVKFLVILINILGLLIPVVGLVVVIYFIPWYSWRKMRVLKKRLGLEEEKLELSEHQLHREDALLDKALEGTTHDSSK